jgi:hypothetical protein
MDILFQSLWFQSIYLLFLAIYITVFWFVLGPASKVAGATTPWYAVSVACGTFGLVIAVPAVMRRVPRQLVARRLRMEPPCPRTPGGFSGKRAGLPFLG